MAYILIPPYIHVSICCAQIGIYQNLYAVDYNNKRCVLNYPDSNRAVKRITCNVQQKKVEEILTVSRMWRKPAVLL